jgi:hypothetical protein
MLMPPVVKKYIFAKAHLRSGRETAYPVLVGGAGAEIFLERANSPK